MKKKILILLLCVIALTSLTGCNLVKKTTNKIKNKVKTEEKTKKKKEENQKKETINIVGKYELVEMKTSEKSYTKEDLESLKSMNLSVTIELKEDKTATLDLFGSKQDFSYDDKYFYANDDTINYTYENNQLKLFNNEESLIFEKVQ